MSKRTTSALNAFGSGYDIVNSENPTFKGKEIVSASRTYITTSDGERHERKGNRFEHEKIEVSGGYDNSETEGDRL